MALSTFSPMKAYVMREHGDLSKLEVADVAAPEISGPRDVKVAIRAAALNHLDLFTLEGLPGLTLSFPHIPCGDGAGVVDSVGEAVTSVRPGDRVMINPGLSCYACDSCLAGEHSLCVRYRLLGEHVPGTLAEYVVVPEQNVLHIPQGLTPEVSFAEAAAFSLVTLTAWRMLMTRARLRPGETVLIWGIGGGVSSTAISIAKLAGAYVVATSSSDAKLGVAKEMGADAVLNHNDVDVPREIRKLTHKRGADVVLDNVGEATWEKSLRSLGKLGRLVTCGATTGHNVVTDARRLFWNQYTIMGSTMGSATEYREIVRLLGKGHLRPRIDSVVPLERAGEAFARMEAGEQMGKLVVTVRD